MKVLVVYESMFGNTHHFADAIADGLRVEGQVEVAVVPVHEADAPHLGGVDLLVVGGPTHVHGMSRAGTRQSAVATAEKPGSGLDLDPDAAGPGLRDWFDTCDRLPVRAAAFDTRMPGPAVFTGRASTAIGRRLRDHGAVLAADPESFLVSKANEPLDGELSRARSWGAALVRARLLSDVPR